MQGKLHHNLSHQAHQTTQTGLPLLFEWPGTAEASNAETAKDSLNFPSFESYHSLQLSSFCQVLVVAKSMELDWTGEHRHPKPYA